MPVSLCSLSDSKMHLHLNENNARAFANPRLSFLSAGLVAVRSLWAIGAERRWHAGYFSHNCKWMVFHKNNVRLCFVDTSSEMSLTVFLGLLLACGGFPLVRSTCPSQCSCFYHNLSDGSRARWVCVLISPVFNSCNAFFSPLEMWCTCAFLIFAYSTSITLHRLHIYTQKILIYIFIRILVSFRVLKYRH